MLIQHSFMLSLTSSSVCIGISRYQSGWSVELPPGRWWRSGRAQTRSGGCPQDRHTQRSSRCCSRRMGWGRGHSGIHRCPHHSTDRSSPPRTDTCSRSQNCECDVCLGMDSFHSLLMFTKYIYMKHNLHILLHACVCSHMHVLLHYFILLNLVEWLQDQEVSKTIIQLKLVCMIDFEEIITRNREKDGAL